MTLTKTVTAKLVRAAGDQFDTLGMLILFDENENNIFNCDTLELPDNNNQHNISCIPNGTYQVVKVQSSFHIREPHFIIMNVPNREGIAIHVGNSAHDTKGCILVGTINDIVDDDNYARLLNSRLTLQHLLEVAPDSFALTIEQFKEVE